VKALASFIQTHRRRILREWTHAAADLPSARDKSLRTIRDHMPPLLDALVDILAAEDDTMLEMIDEVAHIHARERVRDAYDVREMVDEYRLLRTILLDLYVERGDLSTGARALVIVNQVIDRAIREAVERYVEERDRIREIFVGILGHDLRTPLLAIQMSADLLKVSDHRAEVRHAERIERAAARMRRMIDDLLDFARVRFGDGIPISPADADLRQVIEAVVAEVAAAHPGRQLEPLIAPDGDLTGRWVADRLQQVIVNLLDNALAHGLDPISVDAFDDGATLRIEVRNQGAMPPELVRSAYEPFMSSRRGDRNGLGLGLYIISAVVRAHGGTVDIRASAGEGTVVTLRIPRHATAERSPVVADSEKKIVMPVDPPAPRSSPG
jgi:signal transduction histidine kinase